MSKNDALRMGLSNEEAEAIVGCISTAYNEGMADTTELAIGVRICEVFGIERYDYLTKAHLKSVEWDKKAGRKA